MTLAIEAARNALRAELDRASAALNAFPRGSMGLTPDHIKFSPEYRATKAACDKAFAALRHFNTIYKPPRRVR